MDEKIIEKLKNIKGEKIIVYLVSAKKDSTNIKIKFVESKKKDIPFTLKLSASETLRFLRRGDYLPCQTDTEGAEADNWVIRKSARFKEVHLATRK